MLEASDLLVTLCVTLAFVGLPALLALYWNSRPSENGWDRGSRQRLLAVGIAAVLVCGLLWLFSYLYTSSTSWAEWYD